MVLQNSKRGPKKLLQEIVIVLVGMKGPWDAFRIASGGNSWDKENKMDTMMEMSVTKCIEIFAECLPSIIIQISAILISGMTKTKILSVTVSALTT